MAHRWIRLTESLRERGLRKTSLGIANKVGDWVFDLRHGTNTAQRTELEHLEIDSPSKERGVNYVATHAGPFRKIIRELKLPVESVIVDLGCGKGKVLLLAAEAGFQSVVGVEFSRSLCEIAQRNVHIFRKKTGREVNVTIVEADAVEYEIQPEQNVFFLFNPFDEVILNAVLSNIMRSFERLPRKIWLIYNHPTCCRVIEQSAAFFKLGTYQYSATEFAVYVIEETRAASAHCMKGAAMRGASSRAPAAIGTRD